MNHPVFKIIDDIVESKNISESDKLLALDDIKEMYTNQEYFNKCRVYTTNYLRAHHSWRDSKLGFMFWAKIYKQQTMKEQIGACILIDRIAQSKNISDEDKIKAMDDIKLMYTDKEYFKKCEPWYEHSHISMHHEWSSSKLGYDFWLKIANNL